MRATTVNGMLRRQRRRLLVLAVVLALAGVVAAHHAAMADMGDIGMDAVVVCLAVLPAVALGVALGVGALLRLPWRRGAIASPTLALVVAPPLPRARSNPVATVVLRR